MISVEKNIIAVNLKLGGIKVDKKLKMKCYLGNITEVYCPHCHCHEEIDSWRTGNKYKCPYCNKEIKDPTGEIIDNVTLHIEYIQRRLDEIKATHKNGESIWTQLSYLKSYIKEVMKEIF